MHWEILQLDPESATIQDVKRAYARLLKVTRPDQDPEGFRKLHEAYEAALWDLKQESESQAAEISEIETDGAKAFPLPVSSPEANSADSGLAAAHDSLKQVLLADDSAGILSAIAEWELHLPEDTGPFLRCAADIAPLIENPDARSEISFSPGTLFRELDHDQAALAIAAIYRMDRLGQVSLLSALGSAVLEQPGRFTGQKAAQAIMTLACAIGCWSGKEAEELANRAFPFLRPGVKDAMSDKMAFCLQVGNALRNMPVDQKKFWRPRLEDPGGDFDWRDEPSRAAIRLLVSPQAIKWPGRMELFRLLPREIALRMPMPSVPTPQAYIQTSQQSHGEMSSWALRILIFIVLWLVLQFLKS